MIKSLDGNIKASGTPNATNPVQPIGWTEPVGPEQGSPQIGPLVGTGNPAPNGNTGVVNPPSTTPTTGSTTPTTGTTPGGYPPNMQPTVGTGGFGSMLGLDFMRQVTPNELVSNQLDPLLASNSAYMDNARRRGTEYAASRGNLNSSIGAGSSQRSAIESALPIAQQDASTYASANSQNTDAANRIREMGLESFLGQQNASVSAAQQDWLNNNTFNREFNGQLALMPIANAADMWSSLMQGAMSNPTVFTPTVLSGYQDFFQNGFDEYISRYLGGTGGGP